MKLPEPLLPMVLKYCIESFFLIKLDFNSLLLDRLIFTFEPLRPCTAAILPSCPFIGNLEYEGGIIKISKFSSFGLSATKIVSGFDCTTSQAS